MTRRPAPEFDKVAEYTTIQRAAAEEGWLAPLLAAHMTPCDPRTAVQILGALPLPRDLRVAFRNRRGRASLKAGRYRVALPESPGVARCGHLRVGLVLHEAAHVLDHRVAGKFSHGPTYRRELRHLVSQFPWRRYVAICSDYSAVYDRHRGPFTLLLTRETKTTRKGEEKLVHSTDRQRGPFKAQDAHETAKMLVTDPRDNVVSAFVYSESEQQFIGAYYEKGQEIPDWHEARAKRLAKEGVSDVVDPDDGVAEPLVREAGVDQPLPEMGAESSPARVERKPKVQRVPSAASPRRKGAALTLDHGNAERWPKSAGAQIVRTWFEDGKQATAKDIVEALGAQLNAAGVEFPASLVSRLKQAGFLKEVDA